MKTQSLSSLAAVGVALTLLAGCGSEGARMAPGAPADGLVVASSADAAGPEGSASAALPGVEEEIWVIARPDAAADAPTPGVLDEVGSGALVCEIEDREVPVPLAHTEVDATVTGFVAAVDVRQTFENPFDTKIEAIYRFPLPQNAAVHEFVMQIGERRIRGLIREREEAERTYLHARAQGFTASLLTQERPNVFTQAVANIEPGKSIDVDIRYLHTIGQLDGWFEFRFPMVVAPRYNPPGSTDGIAAVERGGTGSTLQATEVEYLAPHERSGHDIGLRVRLETGLEPEEIHSPSHAVRIEAVGEGTAVAALRESDSIPNRDFVLRWRLGGDEVRATMLTSHRGDDGYFAMLVLPPTDLGSLPRRPIELTFVLDRSGSMSGDSISVARRAIRRCLGELTERDTFNLVSFSTSADRFEGEAVAADERNLARALRWLDRVEADGGTEMIQAVKAAFPKRAPDSERVRCVAFLTDGHVGNEAEVLELLSERLHGARVFSFAVGSASNQFLAERMARLGQGAVAFLGQGDDPDDVMRLFLSRVTRPALEDVSIDWGGAAVSEVFPAEMPDLYAGRPVVVTGRYTGSMADVALSGSVAGEARRVPLDAHVDNSAHPGIPTVWARRKVASVVDAALVSGATDTASFRRQVQELALEHGLLSDFTAFVAVDSSRPTEGDHGVTVPVPLPVPDGLRYDTTVGGDQAE